MLRLFLFFPLLLLSQELFILPQESEYALYSLKKKLSKANKEVYLFTPSLNDYLLVNTLKKLNKEKVTITLISSNTNKQNSAISALSLLENVHFYTLLENDVRKIKGTVVCIDDTTLYLSSQNLAHTNIRQDYGFTSLEKKNCTKFFTRLLKLATKIR